METIIEAAKRSGDMLTQGVVEILVRSGLILNVMPFDTIQGGGVKHNFESQLPAVGFRGINESYTPGSGKVDPKFDPLMIAGGDIDVDTHILRTMGRGQKAAEVRRKVRALGLRIAAAIIKGDPTTDPREFAGLQVRATAGQTIAAGNTSGGDALSLYKLDTLIAAVDNPTHLVMNKSIGLRLSQAARNTSVGGFITWEKNEFGMQVMYYNGLPIVIIDKDNERDDVLPFTEANPGGGSAASTSIYCASIGPDGVHGIQSSPIMVRDLGELDSEPKERVRVEWDIGLVHRNEFAFARLNGVKDAPVTA